jgi:hypothetical protein
VKRQKEVTFTPLSSLPVVDEEVGMLNGITIYDTKPVVLDFTLRQSGLFHILTTHVRDAY